MSPKFRWGNTTDNLNRQSDEETISSSFHSHTQQPWLFWEHCEIDRQIYSQDRFLVRALLIQVRPPGHRLRLR